MSTARTKENVLAPLLRSEQRGSGEELSHVRLGTAASNRPHQPVTGGHSLSAVDRSGYRPEIDGLRAIAVVLVVLYHAEFRLAGFDAFAGGFIGVDIFFVISGYLIGSIILKEIQGGTFSFVRFYERRARRILPALYIVLAASIPLAWFWLLPGAYKDWSSSLFATVLSVANVYFWHSGSYDAADNLFRPLIHTWSLGVEEQFYLLFPCFLVLLFKRARNSVFPVLLTGCVGSLIVAEWVTQQAASASFFLLPSRIWELGLGAALAKLELDRGRLFSARSSKIMPLIGLALLMLGVLVMRPQWHHPGVMTLIPVVGSALLIWYSGANDLVTRLLSSRPFVFVGLISYSFYLWHQPIFAFGRLSATEAIDVVKVLAWIAMAFLLAVGTYFFVEMPTRNRARTSSRRIWFVAALGAAVLGGAGWYGYATGGAGGRFADDLAPIAAASLVHEAGIVQDGKSCLNFTPERGPCSFKGPNPKGYSLVSLGDSHARTLTGPMRDESARNLALAAFIPLNRGGCVFLLGMRRVDADQPSCPDDYNDKRLSYLAQLDRPVAVLLSRLPLLVEQRRYDNGEGGIEPGDDRPYLAASGAVDPAAPDAVAAAVSNTVHKLLDQGVKVVLVYPIPEMGWNVPQVLLMRARWQSDPLAFMQAEPISVSYQNFLRRTRRTYEIYDRIGDDPNLVRVYPEKAFCDGQRCFANHGSRIYFRDDNHLSNVGAAKLVGLIMDSIQERWGP